MKHQRGISLSQVMVWGFLAVIVVGLGMKVAPSWIEYSKTLAAAKRAVSQATGQSTVRDIRQIYAKQAEIDNLSVVKPEMLEITKDGNQIVINFEFNDKVPLFGPVSLLIEYQGSTAGTKQGE